MKALLRRLLNRETISYLFFGAVTVAVNYIAFELLIWLWGVEASLWANVLAFVVAVITAYITNKLFVFQSKSWSAAVLKKELPMFFGARLASFIFEEAALLLSIAVFHADKAELFGVAAIHVVKLVLSALVIIMNYIFSKFFIFTGKHT